MRNENRSWIKKIGWFLAGGLVAVPLISMAQSIDTSGIATGQPVNALKIKTNFEVLKSWYDTWKTDGVAILTTDPVSVSIFNQTVLEPNNGGYWVATCPPKYKVVGGGCVGASSHTQANFAIVVTSSKNAGSEAWSCLMRNVTGQTSGPISATANCVKNTQ